MKHEIYKKNFEGQDEREKYLQAKDNKPRTFTRPEQAQILIGVLFCIAVLIGGVYIADVSMKRMISANPSYFILPAKLQQSYDVLSNSLNSENFSGMSSRISNFVGQIYDVFTSLLSKLSNL